MYIKYLLALTASIFFSCMACASTQHPGTVALLSICPGDKPQVPKKSEDEAVAFFAALITPIFTGIVSQSVKAVGKHLTDAAAEKSVDTLHEGSYFYRWGRSNSKENYLANLQCVVVATKMTYESKRTLDELVENYPSKMLAIKIDGDTGAVRIDEASSKYVITDAGKTELKKTMSTMGFSDKKLPGVLAVFDLEISVSNSAARLVPRYVFMDHSIREKKQDGKSRTFSYEFAINIPQQAEPLAKPFVKIERLLINRPKIASRYTLDEVPGEYDELSESSNWFSIPAIDTASTVKAKNFDDAKKQRGIETNTATLALLAASELGAFDRGDTSDPYTDYLTDGCPSVQKIRGELYPVANSSLLAESAKPKDKMSTIKVAGYTQLKTFLDSCLKWHTAGDTTRSNAVLVGDFATPYDVTVNIKEFRKRPIAEFMGSVFSSEDVQKGIVGALDAQFNPVTRDALAQEKIALRESLETAIFEAESAKAKYENPKDAAEKATAYIDMENKRRKANRVAGQLDVDPPYSGSGTWVSL